MLAQLVEDMLGGDRRALSRLFSLVEEDAEALTSVMRAIYPHAGRAYCVGVTGPPGAGKSTIVDRLIRILRDESIRVGVLAVDPTSPITGGAVLGDRVRMRRHSLDRGVFIRSLATRGAHGGLSPAISAPVRLMAAFGMEVIFLETVGVGQTELDIMRVADTVVVVLVPEAGDGVQAMKAGLVEIADIFAVNKADRSGAERLAAAIEEAVQLGGQEPPWSPPVVLTQAHRGEGIQRLHDEIQEHRSAVERGPDLDRRRMERHRNEFAEALRESLGGGIARMMSEGGALKDIAARVESGELDPYSAVSEAMGDSELVSRLARELSEPSE